MGMSLIFMFFSAAVCLLGPAVAVAILIRKLKANWTMFVLGLVSFTVSQLLLRKPILNEILFATSFGSLIMAQLFLNILINSLSAGVFEEAGRYVSLRFLHRGLLTWENGVLFGLGHGGIEAFGTGLYYVNLISGTVSGSDSITALSDPVSYFLMGGIERIFAIAIHISLTMLVMYAVKRRRIWCFILAILVHGIINIVYPLFRTLSDWAADGIFALFAIIAVVFTVKIKPALNGLPEMSKGFLE